MRERITGFMLIVYALLICSFLSITASLPFRLFDIICDGIYRIWYAESQLVQAVIYASREAFPRFYLVQVIFIFGIALYGAWHLFRRFGLAYLLRLWQAYLSRLATSRYRLFVFITWTSVLLLAIAVEECGLRLAHIHSPYESPYRVLERGWMHIFSPDREERYSTSDFTYTIRTNALGYVDREWSPRKKDSLRIACFGDSFTEGVGGGDSSYPYLLQQLMPRTEVMNFGIAGSDPVFNYLSIKKHGLLYAPDIVIQSVNISDLNDIIIRRGFGRFRQDGTNAYRPAPWWEGLYSVSAISRLYLHRAYSFDEHTHLPGADMPAETTAAILTIDQALDSIHDICAAHHIRCIFVFHPVRPEVDKGQMDCAAVMRYAQGKHYEVIDMLQEFHRLGMSPQNSKNYYWLQDGHNNSAGYSLFARALKDYFLPPVSTHHP